ncbi:hypothetical protein [Paractinoplanes toevensis]|uniref:Uncharacterized protein n=1 Tax=Paractinoplanes toevensis TaxID=571911 RepID=A0A919TE04_9ACTN|nr:hypothetical protein [Actinoplanes toevensis]GIM93810.1 hypothetical protein Ato02nite_056030 [Actinoplanes toevensis]
MAQNDASGEEDQWQRFVTFWRGVRVNVVANLVAAAILYPIGVLFGLLPKNRAAVLTAGLFLLLALMVMLFAVSRSRRVTYRLRERAWLTAWLVGVAGLGVGAYVTPESPERTYFALAAASMLVIWVGVIREYRRGVPVHVIMSKNPRKPYVPIAQPDAPAGRQEIAVGDRWRSWRATHVADRDI